MLLSLIILVVLGVRGGAASNYYHDSSYGDYGYGGGYGYSHPTMHTKERNLKLTCLNGDRYDGFAINIQEKMDDKYGHGTHPGYGDHFDLFSKKKDKGLNATIQIVMMGTGLTVGGETTISAGIIITEKGFVDSRGCRMGDFGVGISPSKKNSGFGIKGVAVAVGDHYGSAYGGSYGGYVGAYNGAPGVAYGGAFGADYGTAPVGISYGFISKDDHDKPKRRFGDGLVTSFEITTGRLLTVLVRNVGKFKKLSELAGRGAVVCDDIDIGYKGKAQCRGRVLNCCCLGYDTTMRMLQQQNSRLAASDSM